MAALRQKRSLETEDGAWLVGAIVTPFFHPTDLGLTGSTQPGWMRRDDSMSDACLEGIPMPNVTTYYMADQNQLGFLCEHCHTVHTHGPASGGPRSSLLQAGYLG